MTPLSFAIELFGICLVAGFLGSLLGLGGGIIVVPALTLLFHVDIRLAIGASIVSVIATSSGAAAAYVRERITNMRVGMFLEIATTTGAVTGAFIAGLIAPRALYVVFGLVLGYSALVMLRKRRREGRDAGAGTGAGLASEAVGSPSAAMAAVGANAVVTAATLPAGAGPGPGTLPTAHGAEPAAVPRGEELSTRLRLHGSYYDEAEGREVTYRVRNAPVGLVLMYVAGAVSGLLGIGSGALKVPAMDLAMGLPMKVSTATSNFMIGVTAAASAGIYFFRGDIDPLVAAPVAAGVLVGATVGSRLLPRIRNDAVRGLFVAVLVFIAVEMLVKGVR